MSNKTIAKFFIFVILFFAFWSFCGACASVSPGPRKSSSEGRYSGPTIVGTIKSQDITESSGLAASKCQENVFWTHNDSGDDAYVFAINSSGENLGTWKVDGATNEDWEDIASFKDKSGKCFLFIGEIGNNKLRRTQHIVYKVAEPVITPTARTSSTKEPLLTVPTESLKFAYPDGEHDAETLLVKPDNGDVYVATKSISGPSGIYKVSPIFNSLSIQRAQKVADVAVPAVPNGLLTGGDISPDGRRLVICDYRDAYEYVLPPQDTNFDDIWKQEPQVIDLGKRKGGESIGYSSDGSAIFAGSEGLNSPVIEVKLRK